MSSESMVDGKGIGALWMTLIGGTGLVALVIVAVLISIFAGWVHLPMVTSLAAEPTPNTPVATTPTAVSKVETTEEKTTRLEAELKIEKEARIQQAKTDKEQIASLEEELKQYINTTPAERELNRFVSGYFGPVPDKAKSEVKEHAGKTFTADEIKQLNTPNAAISTDLSKKLNKFTVEQTKWLQK